MSDGGVTSGPGLVSFNGRKTRNIVPVSGDISDATSEAKDLLRGVKLPALRDGNGNLATPVSAAVGFGNQDLSITPYMDPNLSYGSLQVKAQTVFETHRELLAAFCMNVVNGAAQQAAGLAGDGSADKVGLFVSIVGSSNVCSIWAENLIASLNTNCAPAGAIVSCYGSEIDLNNQFRHFGDADGAAGALAATGNFYGILLTGVASYRKSAGIFITDVVAGAWNRGVCIGPSAISATGSSFQDVCQGHWASLDIRGAPVWGIFQPAPTPKNLLGGTLIVGQNVGTPLAQVHINANPLPPAEGSRLDIWRAESSTDNNNSKVMNLRASAIRASAFNAGAGDASAMLRLECFVDTIPQGHIDFNPVGIEGGIGLGTNNGRNMLLRPDASVQMDGAVGFNGTSPLAKPSISGAKSGNAALASLIAALVSYGLISDATSA